MAITWPQRSMALRMSHQQLQARLLTSSTGIVGIGARGNVAGPSLGITGKLAYLVYYSRALSAAERAQNYSALAAIATDRGITLPLGGGDPDNAGAPQPDQDGVVDLSDYIINDAAADNTERLLALRDVLHQHRDRALTLRFPPGGEVRYTDNRWLWGAGDVTIEGDGTGFRCVSDSVWEEDTRPFNVKTPFHVLGPVSRAEEHRQGNPFTVGELLSEAGLADYEGQRILIYGYDTQQDGFPPNPRFFHYTRVVGGALEDPLPWEPDDRWPDFEQFTGTIGRPRILSLDRKDYYHPRRIVLRNLRLLPNPKFDLAPSTLSTDWLEMEDVEATYVTFTICQDVRLRRVRGETWEPDKIIEALVMEDCDATEHFGGVTGVREFLARNCRFALDVRGAGPDMTFEGCTFAGAPVSDWGIWRLSRAGPPRACCFVTAPLTRPDRLTWCTRSTPARTTANPNSFPMIEVLEVLRGGDIAVRPVGRWAAAPDKIWGDMAEGQPLMDRTGAVKGHVLGLYSDGRPVVRVAWLERPVVGAIYQFWLIFGRFDGGGNTVTGRDVPLWRGKFESVQAQDPPEDKSSMVHANAEWGSTAQRLPGVGNPVIE